MKDKGSSYRHYVETRGREVNVIQQRIAPSALSMERVRTWVVKNGVLEARDAATSNRSECDSDH